MWCRKRCCCGRCRCCRYWLERCRDACCRCWDPMVWLDLHRMQSQATATRSPWETPRCQKDRARSYTSLCWSCVCLRDGGFRGEATSGEKVEECWTEICDGFQSVEIVGVSVYSLAVGNRVREDWICEMGYSREVWWNKRSAEKRTGHCRRRSRESICTTAPFGPHSSRVGIASACCE